ncbi:5-oxoprolinase subunit PxpC [Pantoea sp. 1.19]|uniref:5-oxoprolinase subunit PxpC n=1 Tax=Pantoea sp. 1.19 TaxID=1925589 RepID=UPI000948EC4A|nr:5-oxoprolinase subunit PxpC [Pantoea sp. 1.19]
MLTILRAGMLSTLQDGGRTGWRQLGIGLSGALDLPALQTANLLVSNPAAAPALEITLGQFSARFERDGWLALTGAGCDARLDGRTVWTGWRVPFRAGQILEMKKPLRGMRSYLAVDGGFEVPEVLGSRSTDTNAGFGGFYGRRLQEGDMLPLGTPAHRLQTVAGVRQLLWGNRIRALPGPEYHEFSAESQEAFWRTPWQLGAQSNRMGYRLQGRKLHRPNGRELLSHGVFPGVIQVPPGGQPIVLMADAQTTGGYPRIACVIEADRYHLAQVRLGDPIHFVHCTLEEAQLAKQQQQRALDQIQWGLQNAD